MVKRYGGSSPPTTFFPRTIPGHIIIADDERVFRDRDRLRFSNESEARIPIDAVMGRPSLEESHALTLQIFHEEEPWLAGLDGMERRSRIWLAGWMGGGGGVGPGLYLQSGKGNIDLSLWPKNIFSQRRAAITKRISRSVKLFFSHMFEGQDTFLRRSLRKESVL